MFQTWHDTFGVIFWFLYDKSLDFVSSSRRQIEESILKFLNNVMDTYIPFPLEPGKINSSTENFLTILFKSSQIKIELSLHKLCI